MTRNGQRGADNGQVENHTAEAPSASAAVSSAAVSEVNVTEADPDIARLIARRRFIQQAASGTAIIALGGATYLISDDLTRLAQAETRKDGRPRLPPGQRVLQSLKPMGGQAGNPSRSHFKLKVHGEVEHPFEINFQGLLAFPQTTLALDVHCVTGWSVLGAKFKGVRLVDLAKRAKLKSSARYVIFEAAHGYTANTIAREVLKPNVVVAYELDGNPLARAHGAPVRGVVPDLYFWKSAKWLTGIRFSNKDEPGYWETRGYHNHADPWREQRHA